MSLCEFTVGTLLRDLEGEMIIFIFLFSKPDFGHIIYMSSGFGLPFWVSAAMCSYQKDLNTSKEVNLFPEKR